ncbi:MAG: FAD-binding oxidoreductase [Holophaga sp.]|nr:FAD-binding oxidoreductase [Holophaga sp.]
MTTPAMLQQELSTLLGPGAVLTEPPDLEKYETGWRYGHGKALLAARPASTGQVAQVLAFCRQHGLRVIAQGANTGLVGGSVPDDSGRMVVLSLERLNRRLDVDVLDRTVKVDAGVLLSALNEALAEHGLTFPVDLPADPQIGGMIAANTGGARLLRYGDVRHNLLGLEVVLADGSVVDALTALRKNNTGLDFKQLFTGTSGVFGVITGAVLQVAPLPRQRATALVGLQDGPAALGLLQALEHGLSELLAAYEVMSAEALGPVFSGSAPLRNPFGAGVLAPYTVLVELASTLPESALNLADLLESALSDHLEAHGEEITDVIMGKPEEFWALRHHISESLREEGKVLAFDLAVPRSRLPAFTDAVKAWLQAEHPCFRVCDFGHWGDGGTHLNLVWREQDSPIPAAQLVPQVQRRIYQIAVQDFAGSYSAEHGVGPHNQASFDAYTSPAQKAAGAALKARFDPDGMLGTVRLW